MPRIVTTFGWQRMPGIPEEDYQDFEHVLQNLAQVRQCLNAGYFPPGLILFDGQTRAMVVGEYLKRQTLQRMAI